MDSSNENSKNASNVNSENITTTTNNHHTMTIKKKVKILKSLNDPSFNGSNLPEYLKYTSIPQMTKPILVKLLQYLSNLDLEISAVYDTVTDEDWEKIVGVGEINEEIEIKTKVDCLSMYFMDFYNTLVEGVNSNNNSINTVWEILTPLFKLKTRNIQFLIFLAAKDYPKYIFGFLLSKLKSFPLIYTPFFSSLLVRLRLDQSLKMKCFNAFCRDLTSQTPSDSVHFLISLQSMLYILCFKEFNCLIGGCCDKERRCSNNQCCSDQCCSDHNSSNSNSVREGDSINDLIEFSYKKGLFSLLNKDVVMKYCEMNGLKIPTFQNQYNGAFYQFPFDFPVIPRIGEEIEKWYVKYE